MSKFLVVFILLSGSALKAQNLDLIRINGYEVYWPGTQGRGDYFSSSANPHFERRISNNPDRGSLTGGFPFDPQFLMGLGMMVEDLSQDEVDGLLGKYARQIDSVAFVRAAVYRAAKDGGFLKLFKSFLEDDGYLNGGNTGYYSRPQAMSSPGLLIFREPSLVTSGAGHLSLDRELLNANVLFHEMLHYALDKIDHYTSETIGWDDHSSFSPIETRFRIVQTLKAGRPALLASDIIPRALDRYNIGGPRRIQHPHLGYYSQTNPEPAFLDEVAEYVLWPNFEANYVEAAMLFNLMSSRRYPPCPSDRQVYEDDDLLDLAYMHALNARLIVDSVKISKFLARKHSKPSFEMYRSKSFQKLFDEYRAKLFEFQNTPAALGLKESGKLILKDLLN